MQIEILGALTMVCGELRISLTGEKAQVTLAMLALSTNKVVSCDALVDELWGENPVENSRNALQAHIKRLRKFMDSLTAKPGRQSQFIRTVNNGYVLELPPEAIDANRFVDLAARGGELIDRRPDEAVHLLQQALRLWRGPALVDITEGTQCRAAASWLDESRIIAQEDLISAQLALGGERRVISQLNQLVASYPLRERFCEQFMVALYRCGRQAEALHVYHHVRKQLTMDLGLEPGLRLQQCYRAILAHDPVLAGRSALDAARSG